MTHRLQAEFWARRLDTICARWERASERERDLLQPMYRAASGRHRAACLAVMGY